MRTDPYLHWDVLTPSERMQYVKRVVLIGAESTGKTTLAERLAAHYDTVWLPEYLRAYVDQRGTLPVLADIPHIARGHIEREDALAARANRLLFCDTNLVTTVLYSNYYLGATPDAVRRLSYERPYDLYLLTEPDIPWVPDPGQRDGPEVRAHLHSLFVAELDRRGLPYTRVAGTYEERLCTAVAAIDRLFEGSAWRGATSHTPIHPDSHTA